MNAFRPLLGLCSVLAALPLLAETPAAIVRSGFLADPPPTLSSHASTICEGKNGIVAAWFGGTAERQRDVVIWLSREVGKNWTKPVEVARGNEDGDEQWACWNPVLFQPANGPLLLFYKVGPSPSEWWGRVKISDDGGHNWSRSRRLPTGYVGPVRNKPLELPGGTLATVKLTKEPTAEFDQRIEVWLAPAQSYLPVRLRITESNGALVDLLWRKTLKPDPSP